MADILAIETSCDETAAAVVRDGCEVMSSVVASQASQHSPFGGVVPEIASRSHQDVIGPVVEKALADAKMNLTDMAAVAVTQGPGLLGALMVGFAFAKALAFAADLPLIGVNHLEAHLYANLLEHSEMRPPFVALVVSGGHTLLVHVAEWGDYQVLGQTLDDAAGEAFDKIAGLLGLGYPGGPLVAELAEQGDSEAIKFPRAMMHTPDYNFSLSGLKTAVITYVNKISAEGGALNKADICAAFQAAVVDVQVAKTVRAAREYGVSDVVLAGGVAANKELRGRLTTSLRAIGADIWFPSPQMCTDNAAMVGAAAFRQYQLGDFLLETDEPLSSMRFQPCQE